MTIVGKGVSKQFKVGKITVAQPVTLFPYLQQGLLMGKIS